METEKKYGKMDKNYHKHLDLLMNNTLGHPLGIYKI